MLADSLLGFQNELKATSGNVLVPCVKTKGENKGLGFMSWVKCFLSLSKAWDLLHALQNQQQNPQI